MLTKTLSEAKKKQRSILIKAMNNDIGSIDSTKDSWNPAQISERAKGISYIRSLVDTWNPAQLNEALKMMDFPIIDTWNPAQIEEQRRNVVFYLSERTLTGNPITLKILGNLTPEVTGLKVTMNPIQDLHGYSNPWSGGAGKNLYNADAISELFNAGITATVRNGTITFNGTATANAFFTVSNTGLSFGKYVFSFNNPIALNGVHVSFKNSENKYFNDSSADAVNKSVAFTNEPTNIIIYVTNGTTLTDFVVKPQLETGSTPTAYAPYSNICPIIGRTEASVTRTVGEDLETKTHQYSETIWWATDDFANGGMEAFGAEIASYNGETLPGEWMSDRDEYVPNTTPTIGAQVVYKNTPTTISTSAEEITLLKGTNVLSTDGDSIELKYKQNF